MINLHSAQFDTFTSTLSTYLNDGTPFVMYDRQGELQIREATSMPLDDRVSNAEYLIDKCNISLAGRDLRQSSLEDAQKLETLTNLSFKMIKELGKEYSDHAKIPSLKTRAMIAKLGGKLTENDFSTLKAKELAKVIGANAYQHNFQKLRMQLTSQNGKIMLPLSQSDGTTKLISWDDVVKIPHYDSEGEQIGYKYTYQDETILKTDIDRIARGQYIFTYTGLLKHDPYEAREVITYDTVPADGKYTFEVVTVLRDPDGTTPGGFTGNHSYAILKDAEGNLKSFGKFVGKNECGSTDLVAPYARKVGAFTAPDPYIFYAEDSRSFERHTIEISQQQYEQILGRWTTDLTAEDPTFGVLQTNCTSYIQEVLRTYLDVEVDTGMSVLRYVMYQILPKALSTRISALTRASMRPLPIWVRRMFRFLPFLYVPEFVFNLTVRILSLFNDGNRVGSDLSLFDIFFRPWKCSVDHPLSLREELNDLS